MWRLSDCNWTWTQNHFIRKETLNLWPSWPNDWAVFWVLICTVHLTVCSYHVTYAFQSESARYSCLYVKEILVGSRRIMWSLSDCNLPSIQNHLVPKRALNHLSKRTEWLSFVLGIYLDGAIDCMFLSCQKRVSEWIYILPRKHLLLLKTSSKRQQPNNFSSSKMSWRRLEVVLKTYCKYVLKTSWKTKNCYAEDVLKTCLEDVSKTCLEDVLETNKMFTGNIFF